MLHLFNKDKIKVAGINQYSNYSIVHELKTGDRTLSFNFPFSYRYKRSVIEEAYIRNKEQEFVIKEVRPMTEGYEVTAVLNLEDLEGVPHERFKSKEQTITNALNLALVGTGWRVGRCDVTRKRTVRMSNSSALEIVQAIRKAYMVEIVFNTLTRTIDVYEKLGSDKGTYFIDSLNLIELDIESNSYDFATRMIPIGEDGLRISSVNGGKDYIENFQYSSKIKTIYWKDERYTIPQSLKEDAIAKLEEISKPYVAYSALISNLAKKNSKYKDILSFGLGDVITLVSKKHQIREKQRIIKITEYPEEASRDTIEIANAVLRFEDLQQELEEAADIINNVTTDNGTIDGDSIDEIESNKIKNFSTEVAKIVNLQVINAEINNLKVNKADIQSLNAVEAKIGTLEATTAKITDLTVINANIDNLNANKAEITDLNATNAKINVLEVETAKIGVLEGNVASIKDIINGNLSSDNIQAGGITGDRLNMKTIFVEDANIININASKISAGEISTNKVKIKSDDGGIEIVGATQQFKDKNNRVRIQMGQDNQGDFNFILRGEDGTTTLIDHTGIKEKAIAENLIKDSMIAPDAVGEKAIDYSSFSTGFNKETNTNTLKATKIKLDNQNQSLEVGFNALKTQTDGNTSIVNTHSTQINVSKGKIDTLIQDTSIIKDGQILKLKDEYNKTVQTVDSMKNTITAHTTTINENTGKISGVEIKTNELERTLDRVSSKLTSTEVKVETNKKVADEALEKITGLKIGVRNLLFNSGNFTTEQYWTYSTNNVEKYIEDGILVCRFWNFSTWGAYLANLSLNKRFKFEVGKEYTASFRIKTNVNISSIGFNICDGNYSNLVTFKNFNSTSEWQTITHTFKAEITGNENLFRFIVGNDSPKFTMYVEWIKLEEGNTNTDWNQATEDIQTEISKTNNKVSGIEQSLRNINLKVSEVETITTTHTTTLNNHTNSINAVDGKINNAKAEAINTANSHTNNQFSVVNQKVTTNTSAIDILKNQISLKVEQTDIDKSIVNMNIGNENLIPYSNFSKNTEWREWGHDIEGITRPSLEYIKSHGQYSPADTPICLIRGGNKINCEYGVISKNVIKVKSNTEYTLSFLCSAHRIPNARVIVRNSNLGWVFYNDFKPNHNQGNGSLSGWGDKYIYRFNTGENTELKINIVGTEFQNDGYLWLTNLKLEEGNKDTAWSCAARDLEDFAITKITEAKAEIKVTTDNINLEVSKKVNSSSIVSTINQTAEAVKIKASKIELNGATTIGNSSGEHVKIEDADYTLRDRSSIKGFFGFRDFEGRKNIPRLAMGAHGVSAGSHNYFVATSYPGSGNNPQGTGEAYVDLAYHCYGITTGGDWSNIKMYSGGNIRIAALKAVEITTNSVSGAYAGSEERRLALFDTSTSEYFNSNLQIPSIRNMTSGYGLVLADDHVGGGETRVRVQFDGKDRFFRPLTNSANIQLGSGGYKWKKVYSADGVGYSVEDTPIVRTMQNDLHLDSVLDTLDFTVPPQAYRTTDTSNRQLGINVGRLKGHLLSNLFIHKDVEIDEVGRKVEANTLDMTSLLHLALYEIQNLKNEIKLLKSSNSIAA